MTTRTARALTFLSAAASSLTLAGFAVYVLRHFQTTVGLLVSTGALCVALGIAFRTEFHDGVAAVGENAKALAPIIVDAVRGTKKPDGGEGT